MYMQRYDFVKTLILSLVTCGIYTLIVWAKMSANNNQVARENGIAEIAGFGKAFLLGIITCGIYMIYWEYKFMEQQAQLANYRYVELQPVKEPVLLFLIMYVPVYSFYVLCDNYNRTLDGYGK